MDWDSAAESWTSRPIPGCRPDLTKVENIAQLDFLGVVLTSHSMDLPPTDGKLYALRDMAGNVLSIPLIASSIVS